MNFPESFRKIITASEERHKTDISKAVAEAVKKIRALPEFSEWVDELVNSQVRGMIIDRRHRVNGFPIEPAGENNGHSKNGKPFTAHPKIDLPDVVNSIARRINLNYRFGGKTLGTLMGEELAGLADREKQTGDTHYFHYRLLTRLAEIVPADKAVGDVVKNQKQLTKIIDELEAAPVDRMAAAV
jgi:hypothetical protein